MSRTVIHRLLISTLLLSSLLTACDDSVEVGNLPGHVTFVGPQQASAEGVVTWFGVADPEGDLVSVSVEVCTGEECFIPELLPGSATIETLPTAHDERSAALRLIWRPECDVLAEDAPFTVHVEALGAEGEAGVPGLTTAPTTLAELGATCSAP